MNRKNFFLHTGIIGLYFLWGGSAYISQMYRLGNFLEPGQVDIIAMRWNYLAQALGIILCSLFLWYFPKLAYRRIVYAGAMGFNAVVITVMLVSNNCGIIIFSGIIMNLLLGVLAAYQFSMLAAHVPQQERGRVFGFAYAAGSIGTYLISLLSGGRLLASSYIFILYIAFIAANIVLISLPQNFPFFEQSEKSVIKAFPKKRVVLLFFTVFFLMSLLNSIGGNYQSAAIFDKKINFELARAFYAIGLIFAGMIADKNRKYGALSCLASLVFPFASIALYKEPSLVFITWAFSYLLLGFYSVYRIVVFADAAGKKTELLPMAGLGLCIGRLGEAASTFISNNLIENSLYGTLLVAALFIPLIILFINLYQRLYSPDIPLPKSREALYKEFETKYSFTGREREIFGYIEKGYCNKEISGLAYISENTVKFHIKNILKKTNCTNRTEVIDLLRRMEIDDITRIDK